MAGTLNTVIERQQALEARFPKWEARTIDQMLDVVAGQFPDRAFIVTDKRSYSYREVNDWATQLARGLVRAGLQPGEHVGLVMANYPEFVALKFAIARAGAVAVPINFLNRAAELAYVLSQSDTHMLVTMDSFRDMDYLAMLDELAPGWETGGGGLQLPALRRVYVFPTGESIGQRNCALLDDLVDRDYADDAIVLPDTDPQSVADIIYTSGTTGGPKGVLLTHDMLLRTAYGSAYARAFESKRRILFAMPMYHVYGYVEGLLSVLFVGGAIIPRLQFDPAAILRAIEQHRASDVLLIPIMTRAVLDALDGGHYELSSLTGMLTSGGKSPPGIWERIAVMLGPIEVTTGYGMTEVTASATVTRPDDPPERLHSTNGRLRFVGVAGEPSLDGRLVICRVVDPATGEELPPGSMGELRMKGPGVTSGYYKKPEATAAAFDDQGWLCSGDLGRIDDDGYITLLGRTKESYRCGGEQVLPSEIEDVLALHPAVDQAYVVPVPDQRMGEVGVAFILARDNIPVTGQALVEFCTQRLARFKIPKYILFINRNEVPVTATGRPRKFLLVDRAKEQLDIN